MKEIAKGVTVDEKVAFGKPVIKGTRIPVALVVGQLAGGMSYEEVIQEYALTKGDILAALDYAAKTVSLEEVRVTGS